MNHQSIRNSISSVLLIVISLNSLIPLQASAMWSDDGGLQTPLYGSNTGSETSEGVSPFANVSPLDLNSELSITPEAANAPNSGTDKCNWKLIRKYDNALVLGGLCVLSAASIILLNQVMSELHGPKKWQVWSKDGKHHITTCIGCDILIEQLLEQLESIIWTAGPVLTLIFDGLITPILIKANDRNHSRIPIVTYLVLKGMVMGLNVSAIGATRSGIEKIEKYLSDDIIERHRITQLGLDFLEEEKKKITQILWINSTRNIVGLISIPLVLDRFRFRRIDAARLLPETVGPEIIHQFVEEDLESQTGATGMLSTLRSNLSDADSETSSSPEWNVQYRPLIDDSPNTQDWPDYNSQ